MEARELLSLPPGELEAKLDEAYKEQFNLRFQRAQSQLSDMNALKRVRRNIARIKTVQRQRELAASVAAAGQTA